MQARAYHSAVRCGRKVWVIGGSDASVVFNDTWVLDTVTLSWEKVPVRWGPIPDLLDACLNYHFCCEQVALSAH